MRRSEGRHMKSLSSTRKKDFFTYALVIVVYLVMQLLMNSGNANFKLSASLQGQLVPICAYIVMAISLNLTVGVMGDLSLGHAGFMSVGAFTGAIACIALESLIPITFLRLAAGMVVGAICAGLVGVMVGIPVLRLKGDYLAIVTLAFGEIIKNITNCLYVGLDGGTLRVGFLLTGIRELRMSENGRVIVDGPMGLLGIPKLSTFTMGFVLVMITLIIVLNLISSRSGRAIMALRDNRIAAESIGISVMKYKMMAFVISAALAGAAGTLYSMNYSTIVATRFGFNTSILILVFVVLGGLKSVLGSVIVAALLTVLPELLRQFNDYRMLVYAIVLILVMIATNNSTVHAIITRIKNAVILLLRKSINAVISLFRKKHRKGAA